MTWQPLTDATQLAQLKADSFSKPQLIFKHSTRCSISFTVKARLDKALGSLGAQLTMHYLDLLAYRPLSNQVAQDFSIEHQSPQALIIVQGKCVRALSHFEIEPQELLTELPQVA